MVYKWGVVIFVFVSLTDIIINVFRGLIRYGYCKSGNRLDGKKVLITGCCCGIGKEVARELARRGATIIMACRNTKKAKEAAHDIRDDVREADLKIHHLDLMSINSVRKFTDSLVKKEKNIDIVINNAGILTLVDGQTPDGFDPMFGTNYFGPFCLTLMLLDALRHSPPKKIINISSAAHNYASNDFRDQNYGIGRWNCLHKYGQSKLALNLFTKELAKRTRFGDIHVYGVDTGLVRSTNLYREIGFGSIKIIGLIIGLIAKGLSYIYFKSPSQGIQTIVHCAVDDVAATQTGLYYRNCGVVRTGPKARDEIEAHKLWKWTCDVVGFHHFKDWMITRLNDGKISITV